MKLVIATDHLPAVLLLLVRSSHGFVVSHTESSSAPFRPVDKNRLALSVLPEFDDENNEIGLFEEQLRSLRRNNVQPASLPRTGRPPNKAEIYDENELDGLRQIHQQISSASSRKESKEDSIDPESLIPSIHDLVMMAVGEADSPTTSSRGSLYPWLTDDIRERSNKITAIASDVDGTLIGSDQKIHPRTKAAIQKAVEASFSPKKNLKWFFPATGKTRAGAMNSLGPELAALLMSCPGVFIQGLYCVIGDTVIFEQKLENRAVQACETLVADTGTSIIAYDGDTLYTTELTETVIKLHAVYGEPLSKEVASISALSDGVHKILICDEDPDKLVNVVRPQLEILAAANNARVTQAVPTMLELLPGGCSKALGVEKLCEKLGINPRVHLLALGDAENDAEMLQMASIGVVMGNGSPAARKAGDIVLDETSDEGGAGLAMEVLGGIL